MAQGLARVGEFSLKSGHAFGRLRTGGISESAGASGDRSETTAMSNGKSLPPRPATSGKSGAKKRAAIGEADVAPESGKVAGGSLATLARLFIVTAVVAGGISIAWMFKKDAASTAPSANDNSAQAGFGGPVERRLAGKPTIGPGMGNAYQTAPQAGPVYKVPTAATGVLPDRSAAPPELPASYQRTFSPFGTLLDGDDEVKEAADGDESSSESEPPSRAPGAIPATHKIADGDTLSKLAIKYFGSADRYLEIYTLNRDILSSPDLLPIGTSIKLPQPTPTEPADNGALVPIPKGALRPSGE